MLLTYSPNLVPSNYHLFGLMKEGLRGKYYARDEGGRLLLRETMTMLRSRDAVNKKLASF